MSQDPLIFKKFPHRFEDLILTKKVERLFSKKTDTTTKSFM